MGRTGIVKYGGVSDEENMLSGCGRWSALVIQQHLQEIIISSGRILRQRVLLADENYNSKNMARVCG